MKVHLAQPNHRFGNNAFLPYSVASLWAYAQQDELVQSEYELARPMQFDREPFENIIESKPDILALSCYIWNWEYNLALAAAVKKDNPDCIVILGGPQVPSDNIASADLLFHGPVNIIIHGEGEGSFLAVLKFLWSADGEEVSHLHDGLKFKGDDGQLIFQIQGERERDLAKLPSPYIGGYFDRLIRRNPEVDFHALWETHRGCPYSCTFCDWGSAVQAKVTQFDLERLKAEMIWFSDNQIELIYNCDANFGMLPRDENLIDWLIATKENTGYPKKLRAAYPKIHTDRIFEQNCKLNDSGLGKGVTLSLQSLDDEVLTSIKRKNIAISDFASLSERYAARYVPTYTELIVGLPGETLQSFLSGLDKIFDADPNANLSIYPCVVLPNSELNNPEYRDLHGLKTIRMQQMLLHGTPSDSDIPEWYDVITETNTMSYEDWQKAMLISHIIQAFHCTGLIRELAKARRQDQTWSEFYTYIAQWIDLSSFPGLIIYEYSAVLNGVIGGRSWDQVLPEYGDISWPAEEASYIRAMEEPILFIRDICQMMALPPSLITQQMKKIQRMWPDKKLWAQEAVWYGRKGNYDQFKEQSVSDPSSDVR